MGDLGKNMSFNGTFLNASEPANPCGLVAKSYFTDSFLIFKQDKSSVFINETNIAWESDKEYKFKHMQTQPGQNWTQFQWTDVENEHFIVWMRTAGLPNFRKLYGRIEKDLLPGSYSMYINNTYDVSSYDGQKSFVLSTTNALGGKNYFLAICYLVVGSLCIVFAIIFLIAFMRKRNTNPRTD